MTYFTPLPHEIEGRYYTDQLLEGDGLAVIDSQTGKVVTWSYSERDAIQISNELNEEWEK